MPKWLPLLIAVGLAWAKPATEQVGPAPDTQGRAAAIRAQDAH